MFNILINPAEGGPRAGGPGGVERQRPKPRKSGSRRVGHPKFRACFPSRLHFRSCFRSRRVFSWNCGRGVGTMDFSICAFWASLGSFCDNLGGPRAKRTSPWPQPATIQREDPPESEKKSENGSGRGKNNAKCWAVWWREVQGRRSGAGGPGTSGGTEGGAGGGGVPRGVGAQVAWNLFMPEVEQLLVNKLMG